MSLGYWSGRSNGETGRPAAIEPHLTPHEAFVEIGEIMLLTASDHAAPRMSAVRYTWCRSALIENGLRSAVPGFLVQCVSLDKFHDFISLLDPDPKVRVAFVEAGLAGSRDALDVRRDYDVFGNDDF
ncbi:hypothetical protein SH591_14185 [Sphingomonas sp. LY54]|uniref:hypothetical protein n=1 Tax=Sphingomonas sp. LY54 TaxID=3095343 RepID=UPI002D77F706|nr:hypothetical protein [Sphingomonas sp. LY54]WRP28236.1 hypothetical protein SH591_14185 [Sphingomonas sp. LY54]